MKKTYAYVPIFLFFLFLTCFTGCGKEADRLYFDIEVEKKTFFDVAGANGDVYTSFLNMQFYQDEPVQLWAVYDGGDINVYSYSIDGSKKLLLEDVSMEYARGGAFLDQDGNYYYWAKNQGSIVKVDSSGEQLFSRQLSDFNIFGIEKLCQLGDGSLYAKCVESNEGTLKYILCRLDLATGEIAKVDEDISEMDFTTYMAAGEDCPLYMTSKEIRKINAEKGTQEVAWSFVGTSYTGEYNADYPVWDFRIREDGSLVLLEAGNSVNTRGADGMIRILRKVPVGDGKKVVVLRGTYLYNDQWLKQCARYFNEQNETWYVMLEECQYSDMFWEDYARQTSVEIASGDGPDILYGHVLGDYAYGIYKQDGFADLAPYLEASGLSKEDFFPCVFGYWQDGEKIYGVSLNVSFWNTGYGSILLDAGILEENREPDIQILMDALLARKEDAVFMEKVDSQGLLERFLIGSEDLWGRVAWKEGTCDFGTDLFAELLEAAKRYGVKGWDDVRPALAESENYSVYQYLDEVLLKEKGKVKAGIWFDDGCYARACPDRVMTVNANSDQKEGAWEFIKFILEERQMMQLEACRYPASKKAFDAMMASEKAKGLYEDGGELYVKWEDKTFYYYPLNDERINELREVAESARFTPIRTQPILDIVYEEASGYFNGTKSIDEVITVINSRVQVCLDEE